MPYPFTPCGPANPATILRVFQGWPAHGRLLPPWTPHAVRLWMLIIRSLESQNEVKPENDKNDAKSSIVRFLNQFRRL